MNDQHGYDEADQQEGVVDHGYQPGSEKIVQGVDIGSDPGDQASDRRAVVIAHRQALQVVENFLAHVAHRFLADVLHHPHLQVLETETQDQATTGI